MLCGVRFPWHQLWTMISCTLVDRYRHLGESSVTVFIVEECSEDGVALNGS
jgi:hypothetical protein